MLKEDEEFRKYLAANGYDVSLMGVSDDSGSISDVSEKISIEEDLKRKISSA